MRIIHTADLHLGTARYGNDDPSTGLNRRILDFFAAFDQCVEYAIDQEADALLLCGDTFKDISPSSTLLRMFASRLSRLTSNGIKVLMLLGNHDSPKTVGRAAPLEVFDELKLPGVFVFAKPAVVDLTSRDKVRFRVFALPYTHPIHLASQAEKTGVVKVGLSSNELLTAFRAEIRKSIEVFTQQGKGDANVGILAAHLLVERALRGAERIYIIGAEFTVPSEMLFSEVFDFIALGHVHSHQTIANSIPTVYSGSLERIDFSEADELKGFIDITYESKSLRWKFIPVKTRRMVKVEVDCTGKEDVVKAIAAKIEKGYIEDAIVRLLLKIKPETNLDLDSIHQRLAPAFWYQIVLEKTYEKAVEATTVKRSLSPHENLARCLKATKLSDGDRALVGKLGDEIIDEVLLEAEKA